MGFWGIGVSIEGLLLVRAENAVVEVASASILVLLLVIPRFLATFECHAEFVQLIPRVIVKVTLSDAVLREQKFHYLVAHL